MINLDKLQQLIQDQPGLHYADGIDRYSFSVRVPREYWEVTMLAFQELGFKWRSGDDPLEPNDKKRMLSYAIIEIDMHVATRLLTYRRSVTTRPGVVPVEELMNNVPVASVTADSLIELLSL